MIKFDNWLLEQFQRISNWTTDKWHCNCFMLARFCILVGAVFTWTHRSGVDLMVDFIILAIMFWFVYVTEQTVGKNPRFENHLKAANWPRVLFCFMSAFSVAIFLMTALLHSDFMHLKSFLERIINVMAVLGCMYWMSCTPRPPRPKESKASRLVFSHGTTM